ncbi:unnamed protein product, partial [Prunus brigantina]
ASVEPSNEVQETQETCFETQPSNTQGLSAGKKKGRGKAKGGKGKGMLIEIYKGSIVTKEAARNIGVLFKQEIKGAWVKFSDYPETQVNLLFERFIEAGYTYTCSEEELKVAFTGHIKKNFAD